MGANREATGETTATRFTLFTEAKNLKQVRAAVRKYFPHGATLLFGEGVWKGGMEQSCMIVVYGDVEDTRADFTALAAHLKSINKQDSVLITESKEAIQWA